MKLSYMWVDKHLPQTHPVTGITLPLPETLKLLSHTGYNAVEIMLGNPFEFDIDHVSNHIAAAGLEISQLCTGEFWGTYHLCLNDPEEKQRKKAIVWGEQIITLAAQAGCSINIGRFRGKIWNDEQAQSLRRMGESFRHLDQYARQRGVEILIEPLRPDICDNLNSIAESLAFIEQHELQAFHLMLDTDHTTLEEYDSITTHFSRIKFIHLADTKHVPLDEGNIPFDRYFDLFKFLQYDGYLSIEVFSQNRDTMIVKKSLKYVKKFMSQKEDRLWKWNR